MTEPVEPAFHAPVGQPFDLRLPSGRLRAERFGPEDGALVLAIPGLSANLRSFDFLAERLTAAPLLGLGRAKRQVVALDLRGRGMSETTGPGTYGWDRHGADVIAVADALGASEFAILGQSMGGFVGMEIARQAPGRLSRLVLIDVCGSPDPTTLPLIDAAVQRLGVEYPSVDAYIALARQLGTVRPWSEYWDRYFRYELRPIADSEETHAASLAAGGAVRARSDREAVLEDVRYGESRSAAELWPYLTMPVLLLRATQELMPGAGFIVPPSERDAFVAAVPQARVVEVDANHYGINTHPQSAEAATRFLS